MIDDTCKSEPIQCSKCRQLKAATNANFQWRKNRNKFSSVCRECENTHLREKRAIDPEYRARRNQLCNQWNAENKEKYQQRLDNDRARYANDPEYREQRKTTARRTHAKKWLDPEWREDKKSCNRKWALNNRDKSRVKRANRRALEFKAPGSYTPEDIELQTKPQNNKCWFCGCKFGKDDRSPEIDHLIPLTRGGTNYPNNIVISCRHCNRSRMNKLPHEWDGNNGRLI